MIGIAGVVLQLGDIVNLGLPTLLLLTGLVLVIMEALAPGAHFIVVGVALLVAGIVGLGAASAGITLLTGPLALAALVIVTGVVTFLAYSRFDIYGGRSHGSTSDSEALKGTTGRVTERVTTTGGRVKLKDGGFNPHYQARSIDGEIEEGSEVVVVDPGGGNVVTVTPVGGTGADPIDRELARDRASEGAGTGEDEVRAETETETETAGSNGD